MKSDEYNSIRRIMETEMVDFLAFQKRILQYLKKIQILIQRYSSTITVYNAVFNIGNFYSVF